MDREVHATQRRAKVSAPYFAQLRAEAAAFAAALRGGRNAARTMWRCSRDPRARGPNELLLGHDADRFREWQLWLKRAGRNPDIIWQATPVCGAWQLQFTVHNFAPALQKVAVEQQQPDGSWTLLHGLHLIEFRAFAAHPRTRMKREFSVPVHANTFAGAQSRGTGLLTRGSSLMDREVHATQRAKLQPAFLQSVAGLAEAGPGSAAEASALVATPATIPLRIAVRGVGQIAISRVELTDGVVRLRPAGWPKVRKKILGRPAQARGFPEVDFERNVAAVEIHFCP
jgi:hypothetical protein